MRVQKARQRSKVGVDMAPTIIEIALRHLRSARTSLREAGAKNAADCVARALKSAEGAKRHAERRANEAC